MQADAAMHRPVKQNPSRSGTESSGQSGCTPSHSSVQISAVTGTHSTSQPSRQPGSKATVHPGSLHRFPVVGTAPSQVAAEPAQ